MADKAAGGLVLPLPGHTALQSKEGTCSPVSPASAAQDRHADSRQSATGTNLDESSRIAHVWQFFKSIKASLPWVM